MESFNTEEQLDSLRRIALLEKAVQELGKPWYRNVRTVITGIALLLSIVSFVYTYFGKNADEIRLKREELRKSIIAIVDLRYIYTGSSNGFLADFHKRAIYTEAAEILINQ